MVSQDAKNGFNELLGMCLHEVIKTPANETWNVKSMDKFDDIKSSEFYTIFCFVWVCECVYECV